MSVSKVVVKKCRFCDETVMVYESHKNAEVSHMDCAFVSLKEVREHVANVRGGLPKGG